MLDRRQFNGAKALHPGGRTVLCVRLPPELLEKIDAAAQAGYRSRNAEIQRRLELSVENESIDEHGVIVAHGPQSIK
jgi:hypothetical protein